MLYSLGRYREGIALAQQVQQEANELGWGPLQAAAALARSRLYDELGDYTSAQGASDEAFLAARTAGEEELAADAAGERAWVVGHRRAHFDEGVLWGKLEKVLLDRAGVPQNAVRRADQLKKPWYALF